jgi:FkbM family methyltransferase
MNSSVMHRLQQLHDHALLPESHVQYLQQLCDQGVKPTCIYDIGCSVLHWYNQARAIWPHAQFVLMDALESAEFLYKHTNNLYHVGVLSDSDRRVVRFYNNDWHPGGNSYYGENPEITPHGHLQDPHTQVQLRTSHALDTLVHMHAWPLPDLIKMDVQGAEWDILKGAPRTLAHVKDLILELQSVEYNKGAPLQQHVVDWLLTQGFRLVTKFSDNGPDADYHFTRRFT